MAPLSTGAPRGSLSVLVAVCLAALMLPLNFSAGAVATITIGHELGGDPRLLPWVTSGFMLTFGSSLMAAGTLADQFGRKRLFLVGIVAMTILSLALCLVRGLAAMTALRALQGFAAAAALAGGSAALAQVFRGRALTRAFSALGTSFGVGLAFGPLLAGMLIEAFGWRAIFLGLAGVGAIAITFGIRNMRESRDPHASGVDWAGALTFTAALACFTMALLQAPSYGWGDGRITALFVACLVFMAAFVWAERRASRPMLDLSLFRYLRFIGVQVLPVGTCYCYIVLLVLLPVRFIGIDGLGERAAGMLMLALSAPMLVVPSFAAWLTRWVAPGLLSAGGFLVAAFGLHVMSQVPAGHEGASLIPAMLLIGCGTGLPWGLMDGLAITVVPPERAGMATGIFSTTRVAGEGIALAVVSAVLASLVQAGLPHAAATGMAEAAGWRDAGRLVAAGDLVTARHAMPWVSHAVFVDGYNQAFRLLLLALCVVTVVAAVVTLVCLAPRRKAASEALCVARDLP